ncbi:MAG: 16S rRNA (cytosine(967)-C(5))-methyltransferase RsmB [Deltaproteobacteria bacterium]|nr:16S rRNA (cytosine(967)-C(5))-methyltransferase RsmB [Deltaproteobacteria bacterium]MBW2151929.1 16S rRNA (cytosine(967)-C(5))-methyltransferase RsmB [Deltaproteobacteria bacterium]
MIDIPRKIALSILDRVEKDRMTLDRVLDGFSRDIDAMDRRDRAFANTLVYGVLRWRSRLDWVLEHFSRVPLGKIDPTVLNILRLGAFQIMFLSRVPASAAVNTCVQMAKAFARQWVVGYVNGLLRAVARDYSSVPFPDPAKDFVAALSCQKSFPAWLIKRWVARYGEKETERLCDAINAIPPVTIRTNTLKVNREVLFGELKRFVKRIERTRIAPDGICLWNFTSSIFDSDVYRKGWFQVQDEAAQIVSILLDPKPGESILDACAGMGGKTGHIAQLMKNKGQLVAMDKEKEKLCRLASEMSRLGISIVSTLQHDLSTALKKAHRDRFDRILLDAPCSGLGVLRRNPDAKWFVYEEGLMIHSHRQLLLLQNLAECVKPSGVLVYAVCSTEPEETLWVVREFLKHHPEFCIDRGKARLLQSAGSLIDQNGHFITFPHRNHMDGFFALRMRRIK